MKILIWQLATSHEAILTIEEGSIGGFGSHVVDFLSNKGLLDNDLKFRSLTYQIFLLIKTLQTICIKLLI